ncbi:hypothetical protein SUGI_0761330 [Cryptomeria japonica]|nr:hypothetical protein SUGI_0761330 [Cryptomeria japonica]
MALDFAAWELALEMKRPLKTELYELHTIYEEEEEEEEQIEDITLLSSSESRHKSQFERFSDTARFIAVMVSFIFLLIRPFLKANSIVLS